MTEPNPPPDTDDESDDKRWLKVFVILAAVGVVLFVVVHLTGIAGESMHRP